MHIDLIEISNFRKLKATRIWLSPEKTVFVGANNSGKTSAMVALRCFLVDRERTKFSLNDFTLCHWPTIDTIGEFWEGVNNSTLPEPNLSQVLPFLDVWLVADKIEAHFVQKLIPTLDWDGGRLGVRLRLEPKDAIQFQKDYLTARDEAKRIEEADSSAEGDKGLEVVLWPRSLTEFIQRRFSTFFTVKSYILDPAKLIDPNYGEAKPQVLPDDALPIDGEPFAGLIRIDEISAQRGFGQSDGLRDSDDNGPAAGSTATRRMSGQLRRYWNKHLDPFENPDPKDIEALRAIEQAQRAFDERLKAGFSAALQEVEGLGYPGITDPHLKISSRLKPVDGLNHDAAVQYVVSMEDEENTFELNLPEDSNGLGYQNLISMIFRLMSFRDAWMRVGKIGSVSDTLIPPLHLVLIEEPEAHLHTQVQQVFIRQAYKVLRKHPELEKSAALTTQLIVSTHSSHVAHECDFDQLKYFRRLPATKTMVPISCVVDLGTVFGSDANTKRFVTRYIKVTHCDLFFADAAVFVEGPAERILVPFFVRHDADLATLHESYITWLEIGGSHAHRLRGLVEHLGLTTLIITDLDAKDTANHSAVPKRGVKLKSRNQTLQLWCPEKDDLDTLLDLTPDKKSKHYGQQRFSVRVAYQCPIEIDLNSTKQEALCNTLEDALVMQNLGLFSALEGKGLWDKFKSAINDSKNVPELSGKLLKALKNGGKAEFALNLLELEEPEELQSPEYIREGLLWLSDQLRERQNDLGIATVKKTPETQVKSAP
jgi:predicted ATP-dependent endonuclease of OLD family